MHFLDQASPLTHREISIILQQDLHWLRLQICPEIPAEVETFAYLFFCGVFFFFFTEMQ